MRIEWTEYAGQQVLDIFNYLKLSANTKVAHRAIRKIYERSAILVQNPQAGQREELLKDRHEEFRYLVEGNYKIVYFITEKTVIISAVFDCRQNPKELQKSLDR